MESPSRQTMRGTSHGDTARTLRWDDTLEEQPPLELVDSAGSPVRIAVLSAHGEELDVEDLHVRPAHPA